MLRNWCSLAFVGVLLGHGLAFLVSVGFGVSVLGRGPSAAASMPTLVHAWLIFGAVVGVLLSRKLKSWATENEAVCVRAATDWVLLGGLTILALVTTRLHNFPAWNGGDGASHLGMAKMFLAGRIEENAGQVGLSGFVAILHHAFGMDLWEAFRTSYFFTLSTAIALISMMSARFSARSTLYERAGKILVWFLVSLPILSYLQTDGFFWHYFGLNAWIIGFVFYLAGRNPFERLVGWGFGCVLIRFTYGLNLPDALLIFAFVALLGRGWYRWTGAILGAASALYGYRLILDLVYLGGGLREMDYFNNFGFLLATSVFVTSAGRSAKEGAETLGPTFWFLARFTGIAAVIIGVAWVGGIPKNYYFLKYSMTPVLLASLFLASFPPYIVRLARESRGRKGMLAKGSIVVAILCLVLSTDAYREPFLRGTPLRSAETIRLSPLLDPQVDEMIRDVQRQGKSFGLFITRSWPEYSFTNTYHSDFLAGGTLGFWGQTNYENFIRWSTLASAGSEGCVFWRGDREDQLPALGPISSVSRMGMRRRLERTKRTCIRAETPIPETREEFICYTCQ